MSQNKPTNERSSLSARKLRGVLLPFPTPFDAAGEIDAAALRANIERWNETGIGGYVALGSTGERVHLDEREYALIIETARACVPREMTFIAGAGQQGTDATIKEVRLAARAGADAVLVITPHFYRGAMNHAALYKHYTAVADASPVPLILYSIPQNTGIALAPETVARLGEHENINGIKDSSGEMVGFNETLRLVRDDFAVLTGHAAVFYAALASGAHGAILAAACAAPRLAVAIARAFDAGEHALALRLQRKLAPLARAVTTLHGIGGLKVALDLSGYAGGHVRAPLEMPDDAARPEIQRLLDASALTPDEEKLLQTSTEETSERFE
ncbi:MAG TPA: dihydrodipicolinate synthase family protein [Pyrinomonadaceae bacterium]|nr:dihydrodipicolinate synthase family protein [Pyrinomonadaceae bacterium]